VKTSGNKVVVTIKGQKGKPSASLRLSPSQQLQVIQAETWNPNTPIWGGS